MGLPRLSKTQSKSGVKGLNVRAPTPTRGQFNLFIATPTVEKRTSQSNTPVFRSRLERLGGRSLIGRGGSGRCTILSTSKPGFRSAGTRARRVVKRRKTRHRSRGSRGSQQGDDCSCAVRGGDHRDVANHRRRKTADSGRFHIGWSSRTFRGRLREDPRRVVRARARRP